MYNQCINRFHSKLVKAALLLHIQRDRPCLLTVCHEKRFIWFRVAKVCTRSILRHMGKYVQLDSVVSSRPGGMYRKYFKFAFVRNPWDRLISSWNNKVVQNNHFNFDEETLQKMQELECFVDYLSELDLRRCDRHLRLQTSLIDLNNIDFLGRFETFSSDYSKICEHLELPIDDMVNVNPGKRDNYQDYYNKALIEKVYSLYRKDIQLLGYSF
ncbi:MAG: sulfotransferase family 2 domain-containing protein [Planctomycetota bacterium]